MRPRARQPRRRREVEDAPSFATIRNPMAGLFLGLTDRSGRGVLAVMQGAGGDLDARVRMVAMVEDEEAPVAHDVAQDLPHARKHPRAPASPYRPPTPTPPPPPPPPPRAPP